MEDVPVPAKIQEPTSKSLAVPKATEPTTEGKRSRGAEVKETDSPVSTNPSKKRRHRTKKKANPRHTSKVDLSTALMGSQSAQLRQGQQIFPPVQSTGVRPDSIDPPSSPERKRVRFQKKKRTIIYEVGTKVARSPTLPALHTISTSTTVGPALQSPVRSCIHRTNKILNPTIPGPNPNADGRQNLKATGNVSDGRSEHSLLSSSSTGTLETNATPNLVASSFEPLVRTLDQCGTAGKRPQESTGMFVLKPVEKFPTETSPNLIPGSQMLESQSSSQPTSL